MYLASRCQGGEGGGGGGCRRHREPWQGLCFREISPTSSFVVVVSRTLGNLVYP
jgi:hypothetical protein